MLTKIINQIKDPLYKNSFFIMTTSISGAGFGFIFWIIAAKFYAKDDVGIATALISSVNLIVLLTRLGLDVAMIRFFSEKDKSSIFTTSVIIAMFFSILLGLFFIIGIEIWSPLLNMLKSPYNSALYILFLCANSFVYFSSVSFNAMRKAEYGFYQNLILSGRVFLLFPFIFLGFMGIYGAVGISFMLTSIFSVILLSKNSVKLELKLDRGYLTEAFHFSIGNYISGLLLIIPIQILPLMVLKILGPEATAQYYIVFSIASLVTMITSASTTSLFIEGSYGENLKKSTIKSLQAIFVLLIPVSVILYFVGGRLLGMIGKDYTDNGLELLRIMILSNIFSMICSIYFSIKKIQKDIKEQILISSLMFILLMCFGYVFMLNFGIVGIGYAFVAGYGGGALAVLVAVWKEKWI